MKYFLIGIIIMAQGCSALDFIKPNPGISVDTEVVVGDKKEEIATGAVIGKRETSNTTNTAETIQQTYNTIQKGTSISQIIMMMLMSFLLGWLAMPSARQMFLMVGKLFSSKG